MNSIAVEKFYIKYLAAIEERETFNRRSGIFQRVVNVINTPVTGELLMEHVRQILNKFPNMFSLSICGGIIIYKNEECFFFYPAANTNLFERNFRITLNKRVLATVENIVSTFSEVEYCEAMSQKYAVDSEPAISMLAILQFKAHSAPIR